VRFLSSSHTPACTKSTSSLFHHNFFSDRRSPLHLTAHSPLILTVFLGTTHSPSSQFTDHCISSSALVAKSNPWAWDRSSVHVVIILSQADFCVRTWLFITSTLIFLSVGQSTGETITLFSGFDTEGFVPLGCFPFQLRLNLINDCGCDTFAGTSFMTVSVVWMCDSRRWRGNGLGTKIQIHYLFVNLNCD